MTNGQIQQLEDLSKCYIARRRDSEFVRAENIVIGWGHSGRMTRWAIADLRRLTHLYRNQIKAIKRNQATT